MFNFFYAARNIFNSVSSTNFFHRNDTESNHRPVQLPLRRTRQKKTDALLGKAKKEQSKSNQATKKMNPTPVIEETYPPTLQLVPETVSPSMSSYTSQTLPVTPSQLPFPLPISSTSSLIQPPENSYQLMQMNELIYPSTSSTPLYQTMGLISPSSSFSLLGYSQSSLASSIQYLSPERHHQSLTAIDLSLPSRSRACSTSLSPYQSPKRASQEATSPRDDYMDSLAELFAEQEKVFKIRETSNCQTVTMSSKLMKETRIFKFYFMKDGKILNAKNLREQRFRNMVKANAFRYRKCKSPNCQQKNLHASSRTNVHIDHIQHKQETKILCGYCDKLFDLLCKVKQHIRGTHWNLGDKTNYKFTDFDRKNQTF